MPLILYQRDDCQLCDEALAVLASAGFPDFRSLWIDGDLQLEQDYGMRVPVLRHDESGCELDWPFGVEEARNFLEAEGCVVMTSGKAGVLPGSA